MDDRELVSMVVFRLRETARRVQTLQKHSQSQALAAWLASLGRQLGKQADQTIRAGADEESDAKKRDVSTKSAA